jgi:hypothetical protein
MSGVYYCKHGVSSYSHCHQCAEDRVIGESLPASEAVTFPDAAPNVVTKQPDLVAIRQVAERLKKYGDGKIDASWQTIDALAFKLFKALGDK